MSVYRSSEGRETLEQIYITAMRSLTSKSLNATWRRHTVITHVLSIGPENAEQVVVYHGVSRRIH